MFLSRRNQRFPGKFIFASAATATTSSCRVRKAKFVLPRRSYATGGGSGERVSLTLGTSDRVKKEAKISKSAALFDRP